MKVISILVALAALAVAVPGGSPPSGFPSGPPTGPPTGLPSKPAKACPARTKSAAPSGGWGADAKPTGAPPAAPSGDHAPPSAAAPTPPAAQPTQGGDVASCPASNGKTLLGGGSCDCDFTVNCDVKASPGDTSKFWQKNAGVLVDTLAECIEQCDDNDKCTAALWVDDQSSADYRLCWQTENLGPVTGTGEARISYKGSCSGSCSASYDS